MTMAKTSKYTEEKVISKSLKLIQKGKIWGIINGIGNEICPPKYHEITNFYKCIAKVRLDNLWGCIDITGNEICMPKYDMVDDFKEGLRVLFESQHLKKLFQQAIEILSCKDNDLFDGLVPPVVIKQLIKRNQDLFLFLVYWLHINKVKLILCKNKNNDF